MKKLLVFAVAMLFLIPLASTAFAAPSATMTQLPFKVKGTLQSVELRFTQLNGKPSDAPNTANFFLPVLSCRKILQTCVYYK